jgi:hypothetical protein
MSRLVSVLLLGLLALSAPARAEEVIGTFTLDGLSFVSFGDQQFLFPGTGSTLRFHFLNANADGSIPFRIEPSDVSIAPIPLPSGQGTLTYRLVATAMGFLRPTAEGRKIEFTAPVAAILDAPEGSGSYTYSVPFTTETVAASNFQHTDSVAVTGMRLVNGVWYAQIVGATTNQENAYPAPGAAVYTVLSGSFDQVP